MSGNYYKGNIQTEGMLVRMKKGKTTFEVMVNEGGVNKFREGSIKCVEDVVVVPQIWTNASKGLKASKDEVRSAFGSDNVKEALEIIVREGDAQESAQERQAKYDAKRREIIHSIQKNYVSADGHPLPVMRIENALERIKLRIDVDTDADRQVSAILEKLTAVMPMKKSADVMEGTVTVAIALAGAVSSAIRKHGRVNREVYGDTAKFEIEMHSYDMLMKDLTRVTKGQFDFQLTQSSPDDATPPTPAKAHGSGRRGGKRRK